MIVIDAYITSAIINTDKFSCNRFCLGVLASQSSGDTGQGVAGNSRLPVRAKNQGPRGPGEELRKGGVHPNLNELPQGVMDAK